MGTDTRIVGYFELKPEYSDIMDIIKAVANTYYDDDKLAEVLKKADQKYPSKLWSGERTGRMLIMEKRLIVDNKIFFHTWPFKSYDSEARLFLELLTDKVTSDLEIFVYADTVDTAAFYKNSLEKPSLDVEWENWPSYIERLEKLI